MRKSKILVVDDNEPIRSSIAEYLSIKGYVVFKASNCQSARLILTEEHPDAAIFDYILPDGTASELLDFINASQSGSLPVIVLTGHGSIDLAVKTMKQGAEQFLTKPVELEMLGNLLGRALENQRNKQKEIIGVKQQGRYTLDPFLGTSKVIQTLHEQTKRVAAADSTILIQGQTGAGKGVLAKWIHQHSPRHQEAFVDLNCAGLSKDLFESELFGHEKGAFTGAVGTKPGLLEVAHRGTVFLDEIGDVDIQVQPRLLKVLEEKQFRRLGETKDRRIEIRLIAATHRDLGELSRADKFRSDLYFRISTIPLVVPRLCDRIEDIPLIAERLLERCTTDMGKSAITISKSAIEKLQRYSWPGNIRELRNVLERAVLLTDSEQLDASDFLFEPTQASAVLENSDLSLEDVERNHIRLILEKHNGKVMAAARQLGISRGSLYERLKKYGIPVKSETAV